jgi:hypothetical protein
MDGLMGAVLAAFEGGDGLATREALRALDAAIRLAKARWRDERVPLSLIAGGIEPREDLPSRMRERRAALAAAA